MISSSERSSASKYCLFVTISSSHVICDISISSSKRVVPRLISQIDVLSISSGILNQECDVLRLVTTKMLLQMTLLLEQSFSSSKISYYGIP
jgi:hypothetical protein